MSSTSKNFRLFHISILSVRNFRIFLLMYPGSMISVDLQETAKGGSLIQTDPGSIFGIRADIIVVYKYILPLVQFV